MRNAQGRAVIRLGDTTDHGGVVKTSLAAMKVHGIAVAGEDCIAWCPKCKGNFRLLPPLGGMRHMGKALAHDGDLTECGARLIASFRG